MGLCHLICHCFLFLFSFVKNIQFCLYAVLIDGTIYTQVHHTLSRLVGAFCSVISKERETDRADTDFIMCSVSDLNCSFWGKTFLCSVIQDIYKKFHLLLWTSIARLENELNKDVAFAPQTQAGRQQMFACPASMSQTVCYKCLQRVVSVPFILHYV